MEDLNRFLDAQAPVYETALSELRSGRKLTHWMWFIFPQLKSLGHSRMATFYGLRDLAEARSYRAHPVLGPRLQACVAGVLAVPFRTAHEIFGSPDDLKFCSCLTLFEHASADNCFGIALDRFFDGRRDERTMTLLGKHPAR